MQETNFMIKLSEDGKELKWVRDDVEHLKIPSGVTTIDRFASHDNNSLISVDIPNTVTTIGMGAFSECTSLERICIPHSVTEIGDFAFSGCTTLEKIDIPKSVKRIGSDAFSKTKWVENQPTGIIYIHNFLYHYQGEVEEQPLVIKEGTLSIVGGAFNHCISLRSINIPKSVREIGDRAFCRTSLENINIPNSVTEIRRQTFSGCIHLKSINIPNSITEIGQGAFYGCSSLKSIDIPNSVIKMGKSAFEGCVSLEDIDIPNSVTEIDVSTFQGCKSLKRIDLPNNILQIPYKAFCDCSSLKSINLSNSTISIFDFAFCNTSLQRLIIPSSIQYISDYAFFGCPISNIEVNEDNPIYFSSKDVLYKKEGEKNILIRYAPKKIEKSFSIDNKTIILSSCAFQSAKQLEEIILHNNITSLGKELTFADCTSLKAINLPSQVKEIPSSLFANCCSLENVNLPNSENYHFGKSVFKGCNSLKSIHSFVENIDNIKFDEKTFDDFNIDNCTLYVPSGTRWAYRHHEGFGKFKNIEIEKKD